MKIHPKTKKVWDFLWHDDSAASWVVNLAIAFLLVKFVIYPLLGFAFGTSLPIVAVVSGSMEHDGSFDEWWQTQEDFYLSNLITRQQFEMFPLKNGFNKGDVIVLVGEDPQDIKLGEVIVYEGGKNYPIIHRVIKVEDDRFVTKGDHNPQPITKEIDPDHVLDEYNVMYEQVLGKAVIRVPLIGWVKIAFSCGVEGIKGNTGFLYCLAAD